MCSFFRRYIQNYSILIHPLKQLLKQEAVWVWTKECDRSFELLKKKLIESPVLATFDQEKPIEMHVDASKIRLGAVLMQKHGKHLRPIAYASRKINKNERHYTISELEG
jgi:hypothetical protein